MYRDEAGEVCRSHITKGLETMGMVILFFYVNGRALEVPCVGFFPLLPPHTHPKYSEKLCCSLLVSALSNNTHGGEMETVGAEGDVDP